MSQPQPPSCSHNVHTRSLADLAALPKSLSGMVFGGNAWGKVPCMFPYSNVCRTNPQACDWHGITVERNVHACWRADAAFCCCVKLQEQLHYRCTDSEQAANNILVTMNKTSGSQEAQKDTK